MRILISLRAFILISVLMPVLIYIYIHINNFRQIFILSRLLILIHMHLGHGRNLIVDLKCVITLVSPLSFCKVSCFFIFFPCLSIVLKRICLGPHRCRSLFACIGARLWVLPMLVSHVVPPLSCSGSLSNQQSLLERKWFLTCFGRSQLPISNVPGQRTKFEPVTTTQCQHPVLGPTGQPGCC